MLLRLLLALSLLSGAPACFGSSSPRLLLPARRATGQWQLQAGPTLQTWLLGAERAVAAGQRHLAQVAAPPATDAAEAEQGQAQAEQAPASAAAAPATEQPDGEAGAHKCFDLHMQFNAACQVGIDRSAVYFPRGSTDLPTAGAGAGGAAGRRAASQGLLPGGHRRPGCQMRLQQVGPDTASPMLALLASANWQP